MLNVAKQDYDPQGASVTILISEEPVDKVDKDDVVRFIPILKVIQTME